MGSESVNVQLAGLMTAGTALTFFHGEAPTALEEREMDSV